MRGPDVKGGATVLNDGCGVDTMYDRSDIVLMPMRVLTCQRIIGQVYALHLHGHLGSNLREWGGVCVRLF